MIHSAAGYENLPTKVLMEKLEAKVKRIQIAGQILRYLRKKNGLKQKDIATKLGIVQQTYAGYENGWHEPNLDILIQLANFHGVTLDYISGRLFDEWLIEPFFNLKENNQSMTDIFEHAKRQNEDAIKFSDIVMDKRIHNKD
ncbi:MAG: helix-turn-helix domain-containing protein [Oscillospiraceae bacterium]|jgi:transcriptional regulator with XRE-family HTH domain|nr:helix-turn-helix domain-containing protein [Oscillospiraceae bacterium]